MQLRKPFHPLINAIMPDAADLQASRLAIETSNRDKMLQHLDIYQNPNTRFRVNTWNGECSLTPLAFAMEVPSYDIDTVLSVLVNEAHINLNEPYEIEDFAKGLCIHTNALTHVLARWNREKTPMCRTVVLCALIIRGANATAPALYEVKFMEGTSAISKEQRLLRAANGQSLMGFLMSASLKEPTPPCGFINILIETGKARFLLSDPDGLFVKWVLSSLSYRNTDDHYAGSDLEFLMDFLCPLQRRNKIAGGLVAPGAKASGELRRLVRSVDSESGMNILHCFVLYAEEGTTEDEIVDRFRMFRDVYGLSILLHTKDGYTARDLAQSVHGEVGDQMRSAVNVAINEELQIQRSALAAARALSSLPLLPIQEIGRHVELPLVSAARINEGLDIVRARQAFSNRF